MPEPTPRQLVLCGLALLGLVVLAVVYAARNDGVAAAPRGGPSLEVRGTEAGGALVVHVAGAVRHPGVYRLRAGVSPADLQRRAAARRCRHAVVPGRVDHREHHEPEQREAAQDQLARGRFGHAATLGGIPSRVCRGL